jgi:hypothetical protein
MDPMRLLPAVLLLLTALLPQVTAAQVGADTIEVAFTPDMDRARLEQIREEVKAHGVDLAYGVIEYDGDSLRTLEIHVAVPNATGKAATVALGPDTSFGFRYRPNVTEGYRLQVGNLKEYDGSSSPPAPKFR